MELMKQRSPAFTRTAGGNQGCALDLYISYRPLSPIISAIASTIHFALFSALTHSLTHMHTHKDKVLPLLNLKEGLKGKKFIFFIIFSAELSRVEDCSVKK